MPARDVPSHLIGGLAPSSPMLIKRPSRWGARRQPPPYRGDRRRRGLLEGTSDERSKLSGGCSGEALPTVAYETDTCAWNMAYCATDRCPRGRTGPIKARVRGPILRGPDLVRAR